MDEKQKEYEEARQKLDEMLGNAMAAGIKMAVGYIASAKDKSDRWGKKLAKRIIKDCRPHEFVKETSRKVDEVLVLEKMLAATGEPEAQS
jgi:hypothetical protein